ncbi:hypothetical protein [Acetobacter ascendens]|uniref:hypothetical protein n=1 Tax=Acetobacter ascendens TaxID=481146 RepID=UPI0012FEC3D4|nr:hypothetical protein [Acetobacter ascendens]
MSHTPLTAWRCDKCGEAVNAENGWLEWESDEGNGPRNFHIVHNKNECFFHTRSPSRRDHHLHYFLGTKGQQYLLKLLYPGTFFMSHFTRGDWDYPNIPDFAEIFRRLHVPYYEEARIYFETAYSEGEMDGANESTITSSDFCKDIFSKYREKSDVL